MLIKGFVSKTLFAFLLDIEIDTPNNLYKNHELLLQFYFNCEIIINMLGDILKIQSWNPLAEVSLFNFLTISGF